MNLLQRMFGPGHRKQNPVGAVISSWRLGQPVWTERRFEPLAKEGYIQNAVGFRCVHMIATSFATMPWLLKGKGGAEITDHPLLTLLTRPAPTVGGHSLWEAYMAYLLLSGNSYIVGSTLSDNRPPVELWNMRPDRTKVIAGPFGTPSDFSYEAYGQKVVFPVDLISGASDVMHVKEFHPLNDWYGLSRLEPAAYGVDRHNDASAHNKALLQNGARPTGALIFQPVKAENGAEQSAPPEVIEAARLEMESSHTGPGRAGRPLIFGGNVDWKEMGLSPRDMDFGAGKDDAARDICLAFGVPHLLVVPGPSTYNNVREAKLELWEDTILPLVDKTKDALNAWLAPKFGDNLTLEPDLDSVSALEPRRESKRASITGLLTNGIIDDTEAREALQYAPRDKGAVKKVDAQVLTALLVGASKDTAMLKPLFLYLMSVGLLGDGDTVDTFTASWSDGTMTAADFAAALPPAAPGATPVPGMTPIPPKTPALPAPKP